MGKEKIEQLINQEDIKTEMAAEAEDGEISYEEKCKYVSVIAQPMASKKLAGRIYKLIKKGR